MFLLDTNALSELRRVRPDGAFMAWFEHRSAGEVRVSVLSFGEILRGAERLRARDRSQAESIERWLATFRTDFAVEPVPVTYEIASVWGRRSGELAGRGVVVPDVDGLLAATANVHGWTLVTRNVRDVAVMGVDVLDPWNPR